MKLNNKRFSWIILFGIISLFLNSFLFSVSLAEEVILVANPDVSSDFLNRDEVKSIFLGEKTKWNDDRKVVFVLLLTDDHEAFLKNYLGSSSVQYRQYWKKMIFTGKARSPKSFKNTNDILNYIAETDGALGYIPLSSFNGKVKKIAVK